MEGLERMFSASRMELAKALRSAVNHDCVGSPGACGNLSTTRESFANATIEEVGKTMRGLSYLVAALFAPNVHDAMARLDTGLPGQSAALARLIIRAIFPWFPSDPPGSPSSSQWPTMVSDLLPVRLRPQNETQRGMVLCIESVAQEPALGRMLRLLESFSPSLPIEVFYTDEKALPLPYRQAHGGIPYISLSEVYPWLPRPFPGDIRPLAALASQFQQVVLPKIDTFFTQPPVRMLFRFSAFSRSGALFFRNRLHTDDVHVPQAALPYSLLRKLRPAGLSVDAPEFEDIERQPSVQDAAVVVLDRHRADLGVLGTLALLTSRNVLTDARHLLHPTHELWWIGFSVMHVAFRFSPWTGTLGRPVIFQVDGRKVRAICGKMVHFDDLGLRMFWSGHDFPACDASTRDLTKKLNNPVSGFRIIRESLGHTHNLESHEMGGCSPCATHRQLESPFTLPLMYGLDELHQAANSGKAKRVFVWMGFRMEKYSHQSFEYPQEAWSDILEELKTTDRWPQPLGFPSVRQLHGLRNASDMVSASSLGSVLDLDCAPDVTPRCSRLRLGPTPERVLSRFPFLSGSAAQRGDQVGGTSVTLGELGGGHFAMSLAETMRAFSKVINATLPSPHTKGSGAKQPHASMSADVAQYLRSLTRAVLPWLPQDTAPHIHSPQDLSDLLPTSLKATEERGFAACVGFKFLPQFLGVVDAVRQVFSSRLPFEIFYFDDADLPAAARDELSANYTGLYFTSLQSKFPELLSQGFLQGWDCKVFAALATRFHEVALLDSDTVLLASPDSFFELGGFVSHGAAFFLDRPMAASSYESNPYDLLYKVQPDGPSIGVTNGDKIVHVQDSSVVVLDKRRVLLGLLGTVSLMANSHVRAETQMSVLGDKELFWIGFEMMRVPYGFSPWFAGSIGVDVNVTNLNTDLEKQDVDTERNRTCGHMLQFDDRGNILYWNGGFGFCDHREPAFASNKTLAVETFLRKPSYDSSMQFMFIQECGWCGWLTKESSLPVPPEIIALAARVVEIARARFIEVTNTMLASQTVPGLPPTLPKETLSLTGTT